MILYLKQLKGLILKQNNQKQFGKKEKNEKSKYEIKHHMSLQNNFF